MGNPYSLNESKKPPECLGAFRRQGKPPPLYFSLRELEVLVVEVVRTTTGETGNFDLEVEARSCRIICGNDRVGPIINDAQVSKAGDAQTRDVEDRQA